MLDTLFDSSNTYPLVVSDDIYLVDRPGGQRETRYALTMEYAESGYTPMVFSYFLSAGNGYVMEEGSVNVTTSRTHSRFPYSVSVYVQGDELAFYVYGDPADPTDYNDIWVKVIVAVNPLENS